MHSHPTNLIVQSPQILFRKITFFTNYLQCMSLTSLCCDRSTLVPNSRQPAGLTGYLGRLCRLLLWHICFSRHIICSFTGTDIWKWNLFPIEVYWLKNNLRGWHWDTRLQCISWLHWVLGITCRKPLKTWVYTNEIEKSPLLLELTLLEICV